MEVKSAQSGESGEGIAPGCEGTLRREQTIAPLTSVMPGERKMICNGVGDESGEHEPRNLLFLERRGNPSQEQNSGANGRNIGERLSEGEFPWHQGRGMADILGCGHENAAEDAVNFAARVGNNGNDDRDPSGGVLEQQIARPRCAGGNFVAPIVGGDPGAAGILLGKQRFGTGFGHGDAPGFERRKKIALGRCNAVEADEEKFLRQLEVGGIAEKRGESGFEVTGTEPSMAGAFALEAGGPVAEALGVG